MSEIRCPDCGYNAVSDESPAPTDCPACGSEHLAQVVRPKPLAIKVNFASPTLWMNYQWAPYWYEDAQAEVGKTGRQARRREVIFAVALAESFLFEFVLVTVLAETDGRFDVINEYFPPGCRRGIQEKWKKIPKELLERGLVHGVPDLGGNDWRDFTRLLDTRNGLVHGRSSRPDTPELPDDHRPLPSPEDLDAMQPGDALNTVLSQIRALCSASGFPLPDWVP